MTNTPISNTWARNKPEKEDLDKTLQNLSLLYGIGKAMNYISDLKQLLQYILQQAIDITSAEKGSLMLYDMESNLLNIRVLTDLDRFKHINDTFGHDAGDRVLESISEFLQKNIRDVDAIARYGGEEFVLLIPDADKEAAFSLAERLREELANVDHGDLPRTTLSIGIASYPTDGTDVEELIKKADAAMYAAKLAGRNQSQKYTDDIQTFRK